MTYILGTARENASEILPENYLRVFEITNADKNQELTVAELDGEKVATFHLTFIQYLSHQGGQRAQVETVRTSSSHRGKGIGTQVFNYIILSAKDRNCTMLQLTTDRQRPDTLRFYESVGFVVTHEGMKLIL